ncbi:hypothetical protein LINPERHAP2_LOCUS10935, partial [Linum perenne]
ASTFVWLKVDISLKHHFCKLFKVITHNGAGEAFYMIESYLLRSLDGKLDLED